MYQLITRTKHISTSSFIGRLFFILALTVIWINITAFIINKYPEKVGFKNELHPRSDVNYQIPYIGKGKEDLFLMGQFNYPSNHTVLWSRNWNKTKKFSYIVIAIPN